MKFINSCKVLASQRSICNYEIMPKFIGEMEGGRVPIIWVVEDTCAISKLHIEKNQIMQIEHLC